MASIATVTPLPKIGDEGRVLFGAVASNTATKVIKLSRSGPLGVFATVFSRVEEDVDTLASVHDLLPHAPETEGALAGSEGR